MFVRKIFNGKPKDISVPNCDTSKTFNELTELGDPTLKYKSQDRQETHFNELECSKLLDNGVSVSNLCYNSCDNPDCYCAPYCMMLEDIQSRSQNFQENQTEDIIYGYENDMQHSKETPNEFFVGFKENNEDEIYPNIDDNDDDCDGLMIDE
ncbi:uncharacterized protein LOC120349908 [Nilaparvata lugens]|uniref:uncharacterized protein LOC120349908 n=1 Tax=Nilaparvata lugens TaxID=108931 RepID=UPI00193D3EC0|nr:uncharacterized protein LOC120349908 [Nilaparvata lugens]